MHVNLISVPFFYHHIFSPAVIRLSTGRKLRAFGGMGKTQNRNKSRFSISANLLIFFYGQNIFSCFVCENGVTVLRSTEERVPWTSCLSVKRNAPPRLPSTEGPFLKGPYLWRYGHSVVENHSSVTKRPIVAKKKCRSVWTSQTTVNRSEVSC